MTTRSQRIVPPVGRRAWRLLAGVLLFEIGTGMTLPLVIVYLHDVRGIALGDAGIALAAVGLGGIVATVAAGTLADRAGAGWTAIGGLILAGAGTAGYLAVSGTASAIAASAAQGAGFAATWVGVFPILIRAVQRNERADVLGANYAATNLGLGIGSTIAGIVLAFDRNAFTPLFVIDACTYAAFALLLWLAEVRGAAPIRSEQAGGGYAMVIRDRRLLGATGLNLLLVTAGFSQFTTAFPAWATGFADAPRSLIGFAFAANTWTIAIVQLPVLALLRGRRRTRAVAASGLLFATCWVIVLLAGEAAAAWLVYTGFIMAAAVFGLGETLLAPSLPAIVNDLAPEQLRGRYIAAYSMSWQAGPMIGPAIAGLALGAGQGGLLLAALALSCALAAPFAMAYERVLPPAVNGRRHSRADAPPLLASTP